MKLDRIDFFVVAAHSRSAMLPSGLICFTSSRLQREIMEDLIMFWPTPGYLRLRTSSATPSMRSLENCRSQSILSWLLISPAFWPVRQIPSQQPSFCHNINQLKAIKLAKHFFEKQKSPGSIVLTSSTGGICGEAYPLVYTTTKHGVRIS